MFAGCSGDSSSDDGLVETTPDNGSQSAEPDATVTARFGQALKADTVTAASFVVEKDGAPVTGTVSYDVASHEARFAAAEPFEFLAGYRATLSADVLTDDGKPIEAAQWQFRTRDGQWSAEAALPKAVADAEGREYGQLAFGPDGRSWLVWEEHRGSKASVWVAQRAAGASDWGTPAQLFDDDLGALDTMHYPVSLAPRIAVNAQGVGAVVWESIYRAGEDDPVEKYIWSARWDGASWSTAERIGAPDVGYGSTARVGIDAAGRTLVAWNQSVAGGVQLWAQRHTSGTGWSAPAHLWADRPAQARLEQAADGTAQVVWTDNAGTAVWATDFDGLGAWSTPTRVTPSSAPYAIASVRRPDHSTVVVWQQNEGGRISSQWWSLRQADGQWSAAARLDSDMESHDLALTPTGDVRMAYIKAIEGGNSEVYTRRLTVDNDSWTAPVRIASQTGAAPASRQVRIAVDDKGRALLAFEQFLSSSGAHRLWTSRLSDPSGDSWSEPQQRLDKNRLLADLVVGPRGRASLLVRREDMGEDFADLRFD